jgi:hypothetical protein
VELREGGFRRGLSLGDTFSLDLGICSENVVEHNRSARNYLVYHGIAQGSRPFSGQRPYLVFSLRLSLYGTFEIAVVVSRKMGQTTGTTMTAVGVIRRHNGSITLPGADARR